MLRLYVDTAVRDLAEPWLRTGLVCGLTTNPTLLARAGVPGTQLPEVYRWAVTAGAREVFLQGWGPDRASLLRRCQELAALGPEVVIKVPATPTGLEVATVVSRGGQRVLLTAVYEPHQAVLAAAAGAAYIAPYLGRMTDAGADAVATIGRMQRILEADGGRCEILAASLRAPEDVTRLIEVGLRCFTISPEVLDAFLDVPPTVDAAAAFERAANAPL